ncbi:MAG: bifunctional precorrin-2 dehydrogenase/sirohydrochlorin ferrochelatase [Chloroflexi bacterium]|nr:bifunctional precorrin-2 dehydrogenase/sirohydrochlorin ferrochelatase [Chloroflexota bacterium]MBI4507521.1 bifunctional precorrin-2 dehydrogenase/sirohydrochlorin ferrochelatase [Chloroflexota bacterium]
MQPHDGFGAHAGADAPARGARPEPAARNVDHVAPSPSFGATDPAGGPRLYPAFLRLAEALVVVVGGGAVAARKVALLLPCQPTLRVVAPQLCPALRDLADRSEITWVARPYERGDLAGALLAFAATDDPATNRAVWSEARRRRIWVNVADDPARCTFTVPAVLQRGGLAVAVSSGSASPALAGLVRDVLAQAVGPEYGTLAMLMGEVRQQAQRRYADRARREQALRGAVAEDVLAAVRRGDLDAARARLAELVAGEDE